MMVFLKEFLLNFFLHRWAILLSDLQLLTATARAERITIQKWTNRILITSFKMKVQHTVTPFTSTSTQEH